MMTEYNHDVTINTPNFKTGIDTVAGHGYFEHKELGDECGGELIFDGKELVDYDGVYELPEEVIAALGKAGFTIECNTDG